MMGLRARQRKFDEFCNSSTPQTGQIKTHIMQIVTLAMMNSNAKGAPEMGLLHRLAVLSWCTMPKRQAVCDIS
jgi:hypothetical protein